MANEKIEVYVRIGGLVLIIAGFLVDQASQISFINQWAAGSAVAAQTALENLKYKNAESEISLGFGSDLDGKPSITSSDSGFSDLAGLYYRVIFEKAKSGEKIGRISKFVDARSYIPARGGAQNLIAILWEHGVRTDSSYEELNQLITKAWKNSIAKWKFGFLFMGLILELSLLVPRSLKVFGRTYPRITC